jgi:2-oxoglutarate ferredoxin oxidoreductase subunit beta
MVEIYQNCNIFNDGAFFTFTEKETKDDTVLFLEVGKPLVFGKGGNKGIVLDGFTPKVVSLDEYSVNDLWIHDDTDRVKASILTRFFDDPRQENALPRPFGVFYSENRSVYESELIDQVQNIITTKGPGKLNDLLKGSSTWIVE